MVRLALCENQASLRQVYKVKDFMNSNAGYLRYGVAASINKEGLG